MTRSPLRVSALLVVLVAGGGSRALLQNACTPPKSTARAYRISERAQLIGGPRALGEVGDFMLENDQIRVIIQDTGFSRGFGVFGGSLIDADLVRPETGTGDSVGGRGQDMFGEMFPAFFLEALEPNDVINPETPTDPTNRLPAIEVVNDGTDGEPAEIVVRGYGGDFIAMTQQINEVLLSEDRNNPQLLFTTRYRLRQGARYVEIETTVQNISVPAVSITLPNELAGVEVPTPFGDVVLFGAGNKVFMPHEAGYDMRFRLEKEYQSDAYELPALPGITGEFIASTGPGVSYGILPAEPDDPERNYVYQNRDQYPGATPHSLHVPFIASAFTGVFQVMPPPELVPNDRQPGGPDEYSFKRYFIIGSGDVASISDVVHEVLGDQTGTLSGRLLDERSLAPVEGAHLIVYDEAGTAKVTEIGTRGEGRFSTKLRPGTYQIRIVKDGHRVSDPHEVKIEEGKAAFADLRLEAPARVVVTAVEPGVGRVPAKVTLIGTGPLERAGQDTREWLFDLSVGEHWRYTDFVPDGDDPKTRRYIETFAYAEDGSVTLTARPGSYTVVVSRGPEYDRFEAAVELVPGETRSLAAEVHRVVDTAGYVAADFHLHSRFSLDSFHDPVDRLWSYAGEGLELVVSTDHNFVTDYAPVIGELKLERFLSSAVGLELTTIDRGHFNGFPLRLGDGSLARDADGKLTNTLQARTFGSVEWAGKKPQEIFDALRAGGITQRSEACLAEHPLDPSACPEEIQPVIVQVNHPRDSILGYFDQYALDQESLRVVGQSGLIAPVVAVHPEFAAQNFSWDFDAIEVFNGKRFEMLRNFVVPEDAPEVAGFGHVDPLSCCPVTPGEVHRERPEFDCDPELRDCTCTAPDVQAQLDAGKCGGDGDILFPGVVEDWFAILSTGKHVVGTANSDSHDPDKEEPGYPRTYVRAGVDEPRLLKPQDINAAFASGDVLMTNGPFVRVTARSGGAEAGMGGVLKPSGAVTLEVSVQSAPWVVPDRMVVFVDGQPVAERAIAKEDAGRVTETFELQPTRDGFVVVEVSGTESMFPTVYPNEVPPLQFTDVVNAIGGSFGLGSAGGLEPALVFQTTPYALTNPVWIDFDGDGEVAPARELPVPGERRSHRSDVAGPGPAEVAPPPSIVPDEDALRSPMLRYYDELPPRKRRWLEAHLPMWMWPTDHPKDVRRVLVQFMPHAH